MGIGSSSVGELAAVKSVHPAVVQAAAQGACGGTADGGARCTVQSASGGGAGAGAGCRWWRCGMQMVVGGGWMGVQVVEGGWWR